MQGSLQEISFTYQKETKTDKAYNKQDEKITKSKFKMADENQETEKSSQSSQSSWWGSWSG